MKLAALLRGKAGLQADLPTGLEGDICPGGNGYRMPLTNRKILARQAALNGAGKGRVLKYGATVELPTEISIPSCNFVACNLVAGNLVTSLILETEFPGLCRCQTGVSQPAYQSTACQPTAE